MKSETGSFPSSFRNDPVMLSFSMIGRKMWTKSDVYGGHMMSTTCPDMKKL